MLDRGELCEGEEEQSMTNSSVLSSADHFQPLLCALEHQRGGITRRRSHHFELKLQDVDSDLF